MRINVQRKIFTDKSTIGDMLIDGKFFCYTLEDTVRPIGIKVYGETAIPEGRYQIKLDYSTRFKKIMPHILNVPNFDGIRIHTGNDAISTEGCLLVGMGIDSTTSNRIVSSTVAFNKLFPLLTEAQNQKDEIWITLQNMNNATIATAEPLAESGQVFMA